MPSALGTTDTPRRRPQRHGGLTKWQRERLQRDAFALGLAPLLDDLAAAAAVSNEEMAAELNRRGVASERGRPWTYQGMASVKHRLAAMAAPPPVHRGPEPGWRVEGEC